jgi:hypothetical protein
VRLASPNVALSLIVTAAYLAAFGSVVYVGDFAFSEGFFFLAPLALGLAVPRWWAVAVPLLVLLPLPILLVVFPPSEDSELGAVGVGFLIAFWTAIQCALVFAGAALRRVSQSGLLSRS